MEIKSNLDKLINQVKTNTFEDGREAERERCLEIIDNHAERWWLDVVTDKIPMISGMITLIVTRQIKESIKGNKINYE